MSGGTKQHVDTNSAEFKRGVETGLNSAADTKNWEAANEVGQELKDERERKGPAYESLPRESSTPLFESDGPGGNRGNLQDEKDETEE